MAVWSITLPGGDIEQAGLKSQVTQRIYDQAYDLSDSATYLPYDSYAHIMWATLGTAWLVLRGEVAGTFPKRLRKWLHILLPQVMTRDNPEWAREYASLNLRFPDSFFAQLGADLGPLVNAGTQYHCDIVRRITWQAGEFGDDGSCFWASYAHAKSCLHATGRFFALRAFEIDESDGSYAGVARCWGFRLNDSEPRAVLFNAYGLPLITFARILSHVTGLTYRAVELRNYGDGDAIYINRGPQYFVTGDEEGVTESRITIHVPYERDPDSCECDSCQECDEDTCSDCGCNVDYCECCGECGHSECECVLCPYCDRRWNDCTCFDIIEVGGQAYYLTQAEWLCALEFIAFHPLWRAWSLFARDLDLVLGQLRLALPLPIPTEPQESTSYALRIGESAC